MNMQELLYDQSLLQMAKKMYAPASHYAPCNQPYQSPADISPLADEQCHQETAHGKLCLLAILHGKLAACEICRLCSECNFLARNSGSKQVSTSTLKPQKGL